MREIIYYVAATLDGFIAAEDGSFSAFPFDDAYGRELLRRLPETLPAPYRQAVGDSTPNQRFDAVLMGRATYEVGSRVGLTSPYPTLDQYVVSTTMKESPDPAVTLINSDALGEIRRLQERPGRPIWLCGGAGLAGSLLRAGMLARVWVKVNPVLLGRGIPLFRGIEGPVPLRLEGQHTFSSGPLLLEYAVGPLQPPSGQ